MSKIREKKRKREKREKEIGREGRGEANPRRQRSEVERPGT